jgi:hypothetical protein
MSDEVASLIEECKIGQWLLPGLNYFPNERCGISR